MKRGLWHPQRSLEADIPLARGQESRSGVSVDLQDLRIALEKRAQSLGETGTTHSPPSFLTYPLRMKFPEGSSVQGRQWNCFLAIFLCHLVHIDPALPPMRILLKPRPFHSCDTQSYLHLHFLPSKKRPKGEPHLDSCSGPGRVSPGVRAAPGHPGDLCPRESSGNAGWAGPGGCREEREVQEVGLSEAPPLEVGEATPPPSSLVHPVLSPSQSAGDA